MYRDYGRPPRNMPDRRYRDNKRYSDGSMTFGQWIGTFIIMLIPVIGQIAWLVWLFGGGKNRTRVNFIRASLIFSLVMGAIGVVLYFVMGAMILDYIKNMTAGVQSLFVPLIN